MKLSIWHHFSSNHSNSFTVVGTFISQKDAIEAAQILREIFEHITEQNTDYLSDELLPAEKWYAQKYDIEWSQHLDWVFGNPNHFVVQLDDILIVGPMRGDATGLGAYVVDELVAKLGGQVKKEEEMRNTSLLATIDFQATDSEIAKKLHDEIRAYLSANDAYWRDHTSSHKKGPIPPWIFHFMNKPDVDHDTILEAHQKRIDLYEELEAIRGEIRQLLIAGVPRSDNRVHLLQAKHDRLAKTSLTTTESQYAEWFGAALSETNPFGKESGEPPYTMTLDDNRVTVEDLDFGHRLGYGLPTLINWLRAEGCTVGFTIEMREWNT